MTPKIIESVKPIAKDPDKLLIPLCYRELVLDDEIKKDTELYHYALRLLRTQPEEVVREQSRAIRKLTISEISNLIIDALNRLSVAHISFSGSRRVLTRFVTDSLLLSTGDTLFDLGTGPGSFLANAYTHATRNHVCLRAIKGIEIKNDFTNICRMALAIICHDSRSKVSIECRDALEGVGTTYNKGYVFAPVGQSNLFRSKSDSYPSLLYPEISFSSLMQEQWLFIDRLLAGLTGDDCRAVAIVSRKSLLQLDNNLYAQKLISEGWVESVTKLDNMNVGLPSDCYAIIFSKGNEEVRFVTRNDSRNPYDFDDLKEDFGNYKNSVTSHNADSSFMSLFDYVEYKFKKIHEVDSLLPDEHSPVLKGENEKTIKELVVSDGIIMGSQYTIGDFEQTKGDTDYAVITHSDVGEDFIDWDNLKHVTTRPLFGKYAVHKGDVIVTNRASSIRVVVVDKEPECDCILTGGMFLIRPNQDLIDPIYLKMFLQSEEGKKRISMCITGGRHSLIHLNKYLFSDISVPVPSMDEQKEISRLYQEKIAATRSFEKQVKEYMNAIERALNKVTKNDSGK